MKGYEAIIESSDLLSGTESVTEGILWSNPRRGGWAGDNQAKWNGENRLESNEEYGTINS